MANYNRRSSKNSIITIIAVVLALLLIVSVTLGLGAHYGGWFDSETEITETDDTDTNTDDSGESTDESSINNVVIGEGASTAKLSIMSSRTAATATSSTITNGDGKTVEYVEDSITLTASYNSTATSPSFTWTSSDETSITLTPSSDTKTCVVTCNGAFSTQITITCTSADDETVSATCTVDYIKRATNAALTIANSGGDNLVWSSESSSATWTLPEYNSTYYQPTGMSGVYELELSSYTPALGTGTISETYTLTSLGYSMTVTGSSVTRSYDLVDGTLNYYYILYAYTGVYPSSTANVQTIYTLLTASPSRTITLTFTGDTTGIEYSYTYTMTVDASNLYTSVSSVSLDTTAFTF